MSDFHHDMSMTVAGGLAAIAASHLAASYCFGKTKAAKAPMRAPMAPIGGRSASGAVEDVLENDDPRRCTCGVGLPKAEQWKDLKLSGLIANNDEWVDAVNAKDPEFFRMMGEGQWPKYLYIGCSDARADASRFLGLKHGELFVHRNVGNCCGVDDLNFLSVLEFSVSFLKVPHVIVCGHYECGAVRNAVKVQDIGMLENWLRQIRDVNHRNHAELSQYTDEDAKHRRLVELNTLQQARNVMKAACVQKRRRTPEEGFSFPVPVVHAFVFDVATGLVKNLDSELKEPGPVYDLFPRKQ